MTDQQIVIWTQIISAFTTVVIAVITLCQTKINKKTLDEMKISRIESVSPELVPSLGADELGVFDQEISYLYDLVAVFDLDIEIKEKTAIKFDVTLSNTGRGAAYNLEIKKIDNIPLHRTEKTIKIININESKQIQFEIYGNGFKREYSILIGYEDFFGGKYEQNIDIEIDEVFSMVENVSYSRPKMLINN